MVFSSLTFIFMYLPITLVLYYLLPFRGYRNFVLFGSSLLFYSWGEPIYVWLMMIEILLNYCFGILINGCESKKVKKILLMVDVVVNLGVLGILKYSNFIIEIVNQLFHLTIPSHHLIMPIGISFYTFQVLSYVIDVYRGVVPVQNNIISLGTYVTMFPQLIAGPIVRYETVSEELNHRKESIDDFANGLRRFILGLGKKVILANNIAIVSDTIFQKIALSDYTSFISWLAAISFALQIYYDFSGYSDMAIGLGKMFGFHFLENFNYPYISRSITEFWRRWHMSLGTWFKDYVYIPLGGNRCNKLRWMLNVLIVWILTGLWHGAAMNFIFWGLYFGLILMIEKLFLKKFLDKVPVLSNAYALILVLIGWVLFNSSSQVQIIRFLETMFTSLPVLNMEFIADQGWVSLIPYYFAAFIGCFPFVGRVLNKMNQYVITGLLYDIYCICIVLFCIVLLINNTYNPFIYFRF